MPDAQPASGLKRMQNTSTATLASRLRRLALPALIASLMWTPSTLAAGSSQPWGGGGPMAKFDAIIAQYNASGEPFRIEGH
jgi:hypothetical protein